MESALQRAWWGYRVGAVQELLADAERQMEDAKTARQSHLAALRDELAAAERRLEEVQRAWADENGHYRQLLMQAGELSDYAPRYLLEVRNRLGQEEARWLAELSMRQGLLGRRHKVLSEARTTLEQVRDAVREVLESNSTPGRVLREQLPLGGRRDRPRIHAVGPSERTGLHD